jgi:hypothetical protein
MMMMMMDPMERHTYTSNLHQTLQSDYHQLFALLAPKTSTHPFQKAARLANHVGLSPRRPSPRYRDRCAACRCRSRIHDYHPCPYPEWVQRRGGGGGAGCIARSLSHGTLSRDHAGMGREGSGGQKENEAHLPTYRPTRR